MRDAVTIVSEDNALEVERWASGWLGAAWSAAELGEREPERIFHLEVVGRASTRPSRHGLAAVAALRRVVAPGELPLLDGMLEILSESQPAPQWFETPAFAPARAWRVVDVWDSEHVLFVEFAGRTPHTLMAQISLAGGVLVDKLAVALAWARCRPYLPDFRDWQPLGDEERERLLDGFAPADDTVARSLADLFLDYGDGYMISGPLCWSPGQVGLFLVDWLQREAALDAEQRAALPEALRRWIRYALERREVEPEWIGPVVEAVDTFLPAFEEAMRGLNAERLARYLTD